MILTRPIGIDLGTTNSAVAMLDPNDRDLVLWRDAQGRAIVPSCVWRDPRSGEIVVGFPKTLRGEIGPQARRVERFVEELRGAVDAPVRLWDEQYSTAEAKDRLAALGKAPADRRRFNGRRGRVEAVHVDALAAAVILQEYLDWRRSSSSLSPWSPSP